MTTEPFLLVISITKEGSITWTPETRESLEWAELEGEGPFYLNASTDMPQIVSAESVGVTQEQIQEWQAAADSFYEYTDSRLSFDTEEEIRAGLYEREMDEAEKAITAAIREVYDALVAGGRAMKDE